MPVFTGPKNMKEGKPHLARGDSPLFLPVHNKVGRILFGDWVCIDFKGYFGRGNTVMEAFTDYSNQPRHYADLY